MLIIKIICSFLLLFLFSIEEVGAQKTYIARKIQEVIVVDGIANEEVWKNAAWSSDFIDIEGTIKPKYRTRVKMVWDDSYLHFYAELEEPHVWATLKQRDTVIFYNNDFEIFIDPTGDTHNYIEFEVNAFNTVWDLYLTRPYRNNGSVLNNWDMKGLKSAVKINGTLNDANDIDEGWSIEVSIPWKDLAEASGEIASPLNKFWRINFSRVNWQHDLKNKTYSRKVKKDGSYEPEYNWVWSPQEVVNMHEPERWGYVYFSDATDINEEFIMPKDEYIKWYLYEVYREVMNLDNQPLKLKSYSKTIKEKDIKVIIEPSSLGFIIYADSPFSGNRLIIDRNGQFSNYEK